MLLSCIITYKYSTWLFILSLQARNFMIGHGGDVVLRMYLFWSIFLPLGDCFSVDQMLNPNKNTKKKDNIEFSAGTLAFMLQISILYGFSALHKTGNVTNK
jgi:hypothetical protein